MSVKKSKTIKRTNITRHNMRIGIKKMAIIALLALLAGTPSYGQARRGTARGKAHSGSVARVSAALVKQFNSMIKDHVFFNYEGANGEKVVIAMKPANAQGVGTLVISVAELSNRKSCKYTLLSNGDFYWWDGKQKSRCYLNAQPEGFICEKMFFQYEESPEEYEELVNPVAKTASEPEARNEYMQPQQTARQEPNTVAANIDEAQPSFPGGNGAMMAYLANNVKYPKVAAENGVQGRVVVGFIVEKDGSLSDVKVKRGVDPSLDREAVRVVKSMPRWNPGKKDGQPVRVEYTLPVTFRMQ